MNANIEARTLLAELVPELDRTERDLSLAHWNMATNSNEETQKATEDADVRYQLCRSNRQTFLWLKRMKRRENEITNPLLRRSIDVLYRTFAANQFSETLITELAVRNAKLNAIFNEHRAELDGKQLTNNELSELMNTENEPARRIAVWEASKQIGPKVVPMLLELIELRNRGARELGHANFYDMTLRLNEIEPKWLRATFNYASELTRSTHRAMLADAYAKLAKRFCVRPETLGPWAWADPFGQEDLIKPNTDALFEGMDGKAVLELTRNYFHRIGFGDVFDDINSRSDMFERKNKNQHAFCISIGRKGDIRILLNMRPNTYWFSTAFHEFGHGVDLAGIDRSLPWPLREHSHIMTTETIAIFLQKQAYSPAYLRRTFGDSPANLKLYDELAASARRHSLIFSRWAMVMTQFEEMLYANPHRDMNDYWWTLVESLQGIPRPKRLNGAEWATKIHLALAPVYYHNYLLADFGVALLEQTVRRELAQGREDPDLGRFLVEKWFRHGTAIRWDELYRSVFNEPLNPLNPAVWAEALL